MAEFPLWLRFCLTRWCRYLISFCAVLMSSFTHDHIAWLTAPVTLLYSTKLLSISKATHWSNYFYELVGKIINLNLHLKIISYWQQSIRNRQLTVNLWLLFMHTKTNLSCHVLMWQLHGNKMALIVVQPAYRRAVSLFVVSFTVGTNLIHFHLLANIALRWFTAKGLEQILHFITRQACSTSAATTTVFAFKNFMKFWLHECVLLCLVSCREIYTSVDNKVLSIEYNRITVQA